MNRLSILSGDCRAILPTLEPESVQCCVTSPPYWGLRDYGTAQWEGGSAECDHRQESPRFNGPKQTSAQVSGHASKAEANNRTHCKCGARRIDSQLGLEATPEEYITKMVAVFREVKKVLRDDGTCWINLGDSYATSNPAGRRDSGNGTSAKFGDHEIAASFGESTRKNVGLKPKDLCMMPARMAMVLQADGWYLRSEIVWHKPNPMPESVTDRPTKSHEMIYLLAKQERYFYDAEAIMEPDAGTDHSRNIVAPVDSSDGFLSAHSKIRTANGRNGKGRNKRSVWTVATQPYSEAHFATFPEDLIKPCILAGSRLGDLVLDPFAGSGTTGKVALELGRRAILIELNPAYIELAQERTFVTLGFL